MSPKEFLGKENEKLIVKAIEKAEHQTSGEIRVHIESKCRAEVLDRAAWLFKKLKMHETKDRNGVLIYLSINDHKFAIIGDAGINKVVPEGFWNGDWKIPSLPETAAAQVAVEDPEAVPPRLHVEPGPGLPVHQPRNVKFLSCRF